MQGTWVQSLSWEDPLEKGMATHSSILAWRIPWTEETGRLQSIGSFTSINSHIHSWALFLLWFRLFILSEVISLLIFSNILGTY